MDITQLGAQDFLDKLSLFGIPAIAVVVAIVALLRMVGLSGKFTPIATVIAGAVVALMLGLIDVYPQSSVVIKYIVAAILLGLAGSGAYSLSKRLMGWETVPPKSVVQLPSGDVVQTDTPPANKDVTDKEDNNGPHL
jgi:thiamine transporter ThiT